MKIILAVLFLISFGCLATTCTTTQNEKLNLNIENRSLFYFDIRRKNSNFFVFHVSIPSKINGDEFRTLYVVGVPENTENPTWGFPVALFPSESKDTMLDTEFILPESVIGDSWFSLAYGGKDCAGSMEYKISDLIKDMK